MKSKKGASPYDVEFKVADLGTSHFKRHIQSQGEATDRDSYGTRAYGRLQSYPLLNFVIADGVLGAPECYRADSDIEKIPFSVKQSVDIWSLGCTLSEAAVWVVRGKNGLSEYRRRRAMETDKIHGFRDGDCFHDGNQVLATVTDIHRNLADDIRARDHVTGATVEMVTKEMLGVPDSRTPARVLFHRTKGILQDAEAKLRRPASYAGTGCVSGTDGQSPPRTPPEPPPGHVRPRSGNSQSQNLPSHICARNPASTSYNGDEFHHQEYSDDLFGRRASQQAHYSDWPTRQHSPALVNCPSYTEYEDRGLFPKNNLNRPFSAVSLSQDNPSRPSRQEPLGPHRKRRRTPSDRFSGADTRFRPDGYAHDQQETYNDSQRSSFTTRPIELSRTSTATLIQDLHNGSRAGQQHPDIASRTQPPRSVSTGSSNIPPPLGTHSRRRPFYLSVTKAQQWKSDKKQHRAGRLPDDHLLADLEDRDHVSQRCTSLSKYL